MESAVNQDIFVDAGNRCREDDLEEELELQLAACAAGSRSTLFSGPFGCTETKRLGYRRGGGGEWAGPITRVIAGP